MAEPPRQHRQIRPSKDWVMLICAIGLATAFNLITFAVLYDAIFSEGPGLSDNATQVLTGWGGGIIGLLGAYVGYKASQAHNDDDSNGRNE